MKNKLWKIAFKWGAWIALVQILSHFSLNFLFENMHIHLKTGIALFTVILSAYFLYCAIRDYKKCFSEDTFFLLQHGFGVALCACMVFVIIFLAYFFLFASFIDQDHLDRHKEKTILIIQQSESENKIEEITAVEQLNLSSLVLKHIYQQLFFLLTIALFIAAFMQRKIIKKDPQKENLEDSTT